MKCPDCGYTMNNGLCSNCSEEAYIMEYQSEYIDKPLSKEFVDKANQQLYKRKIQRITSPNMQEEQE